MPAKKNIKKTKDGGGKLARSQITTVRLDPKLKLAAELAARKHRRTLSAFIEWCVAEMVINVEVGSKNKESAFDAMTRIWRFDEAERFWAMAINYSHLMSFEEGRLWELIQETQETWDEGYQKNNSKKSCPSDVSHPDFDKTSIYYCKAYYTLKSIYGKNAPSLSVSKINSILRNEKEKLIKETLALLTSRALKKKE